MFCTGNEGVWPIFVKTAKYNVWHIIKYIGKELLHLFPKKVSFFILKVIINIKTTHFKCKMLPKLQNTESMTWS